MAGIDRRPGDTEVGGKPGDKDRVDPTLFEIASQSGVGFLVRFEEGRVAVDLVVEAFADNQLSFRVCPGTSNGITKFSEHEAD